MLEKAEVAKERKATVIQKMVIQEIKLMCTRDDYTDVLKRNNYLWSLVRYHFHLGNLKLSQSMKIIVPRTISIKDQIDLIEDDRWKCLIKVDSTFYHLWETTLSFSVIYLVFLIPVSVATQNVDLFITLKRQKLDQVFFVKLQILIDFWLCFITEHK